MLGNIVNLTPHPLQVYDEYNEDVLASIPSSGVARLDEEVELTYEGGWRTGRKILTGKVTGWDPQPDFVYYVSLPFAVGAAALGMDISQMRVSLKDHRNEKGAVDGTYAIGELQIASDSDDTVRVQRATIYRMMNALGTYEGIDPGRVPEGSEGGLYRELMDLL